MLPNVGQFHCVYHRRGNIIKNCGGGSGKTKFSALWAYNALVKCRTVHQIEAFKNTNFKHMRDKDVAYLMSLPNESQFPAARCNQGDDVYMCLLEASSGADESMNSANYSMRQRTAVDMVNAMLLLVDMEIKRYKKQQSGSYFGSCTCGVDKRDAVPCEHMAVVAAGSRVKNDSS